MKERPILFSAPMVRALLDGTKTQTRRIVKPQPFAFAGGPGITDSEGRPFPRMPAVLCRDGGERLLDCPYGAPGDRLWVREGFSYEGGQSVADRGLVWFWADGNPPHGDWTRPKPSIHMPRWASRILLEITEVRVERLQAISDADAVAEGCGCTPSAIGVPITSPPGDTVPRAMFRSLWESINGADSWAANPWAWVVEFERAKD